MRHDYFSFFRRFLFLQSTIFVLLLQATAATNGTDTLREYLETRAGFDGNDILKMERGEVVSKLLPAEAKHEIAFCGVVSIGSLPQKGFELFQQMLARLDKKSLIAFGSFSETPTLADLEALTLEKGDIEALKRCRVGACDLKLSAEMIKRFQDEVEWDGANYADQANDLFRRLIIEYVFDYKNRGESALIEYKNKKEPLSLRSENELLRKELGWIGDFAPEFLEYLQSQTPEETPNIKRSIGWAKIKFGLKPAILITEVITFTKNNNEGGGDLLLSVSRQIYANHYVDSSMGLIAVLPERERMSADRSFLVYVNHSRSSVLRGIFGKFARKIVQHEVTDKLKLLLENTASAAERDGLREELSPAELTTGQRFRNWISEHPYVVGLVVLIIAVLVINRFVRPRTLRNSRRP